MCNADAAQRLIEAERQHANWFKPNSWNSSDDQALKAAIVADLRRVAPSYVLPSALQRIRALHGAAARTGDSIHDAVLAEVGPDDVNWGPLVASTLPRMTPDDAKVRWGGHVRPPRLPPGQPNRRDASWNKAEKAVLRAAVEQHGSNDWPAVAAAVGGGRHPFECLSAWASTAHAVNQHKWEEQDDTALVAGMQEHLFAYTAAQGPRPVGRAASERPSYFALQVPHVGPDGLLGDGLSGNTPLANWEWLSHCLPGRRVSSIRARWELTLDPCISRHRFSPMEDAKLVHLQAAFDSDWTAAAAHMPGRTPPQIRERWQNVLDPSVSKAPWQWVEVLALARMVRQVGLSKWAAVSAALQAQGIQRSDNQCWHKWCAMVRDQPQLSALGEGAPEGDPESEAVQALLRKATQSSKVSAAHGRSAGVKHKRVVSRAGGTITALVPAVPPPSRGSKGGASRGTKRAAPPLGASSDATIPPVHIKRGRALLSSALKNAGEDPAQLAAAVATAVQSAPPTAAGSTKDTSAAPHAPTRRQEIPLPHSFLHVSQAASAGGAGTLDCTQLLQAAADVHALMRAALRCNAGHSPVDDDDTVPALTAKCTATLQEIRGAPARGVVVNTRGTGSTEAHPGALAAPRALPSSLHALWRGAQAAAAGDMGVQWMGATGAGAWAAGTPAGEAPFGGALGAVCTAHGSAVASWLTRRSTATRVLDSSLSTGQWWSALQQHVNTALSKQLQPQHSGAAYDASPPLVRIGWLPYGAPVLVWQREGVASAQAACVLPVNVHPPSAPPGCTPLKRGDAPLKAMHQHESWQLQRWSLIDTFLGQHAFPEHPLTAEQAAEAGVLFDPPCNSFFPPSHIPLSGVAPWGSAQRVATPDATQGAYEPALPIPPCAFLHSRQALSSLTQAFVPFSKMFARHGLETPCTRFSAVQSQSSRRRAAPRVGGSIHSSDSDGSWASSSDGQSTQSHAAKNSSAPQSTEAARPPSSSRPRRARQARRLDGAFMVLTDDMVDADGELL